MKDVWILESFFYESYRRFYPRQTSCVCTSSPYKKKKKSFEIIVLFS